MSVRQAPVSFYEKGKQMKKGEILEGVVKELRFPNKGILEIEGAPVVVKNAVPGQKIRFSVTKARSGRGEGRLLEVLEKAPGEIEAPCPHDEKFRGGETSPGSMSGPEFRGDQGKPQGKRVPE